MLTCDYLLQEFPNKVLSKEIWLLVTKIWVSIFLKLKIFFFLLEIIFIKTNLAERTLKGFKVFAWKFPKRHRKIQNYGNHPTFYDTEHFQKSKVIVMPWSLLTESSSAYNLKQTYHNRILAEALSGARCYWKHWICQPLYLPPTSTQHYL